MGIFDFLRKQKPENNPKTGIQRKRETERQLKSLNIPFISHLPKIEEEYEVKIQTATAIARRVLIMTYLNYVSEVPSEKEDVIEFLKIHSLWEQVSHKEKELFLKEKLSKEEVIQISWRSEAIWLLLWTIEKVENLELPQEQVKVNEIVSRLPGFLEDPKEFLENVFLRPTTEILDISDLLYRLHWATIHSELNNSKSLKLNSSIVLERHYAVNWVTCYEDNWDDITTDT